MKLSARVRCWFRASLRRTRMEREMDNELHYHLERYTEDLIRQGVSPEDARRRARAEFGAIEARKEECREALGLRLLDELRADVRYAFRMMRKSPAFTAVAVISLALGIGANTAIFTLMEAALWKSIPIKSPEQLRLFSWVSGPEDIMDGIWGSYGRTPNGGHTSTVFSNAVFQEMQRNNAVFDNLFAFKPVGRITAVIDGQVELVGGELVSGGFYEGIGISTIAGRPIGVADDTRGAEGAVAVLSDSYWARRFARDASVIGKQIDLNQIPVTIIGVNPPDFKGMEQGETPDVFVPLSMQPLIVPNQYAKNGTLLDDPDNWWLLIMGRLKRGLTELQAQAALDVVLEQAVRASLPNKKNRDLPRLRLLTGARGLDELREHYSKPLFVLISFVGLVLLAACANVANLLLARATARQREIGVRLALGAGRGRISRQMLAEGSLLALMGGATGLLFGYWARNGIPSLLSTSWEPSPLQGQFDSQVLMISIGVTIITGVLFSLAPAWQANRVELNAALKDGVRTTMSLPKLIVGNSLVVFQVCLSLLLLVGAGLFIRTLSNLRSATLGFRPERVLLFTVDPPRTRYAGDKRKALFKQLEEQIGAIPGVQSATLSEDALVANNSSTTTVAPTGRVPRKGEADRVWVNDVGDRFFETMGIPILYGRPLGQQDRANSPRVAVVNKQFVRDFFPKDPNPLGKTFGNSDTYQIVGICGDAHYTRVREQVPPTFYRPYTQVHDLRGMTFEVKTAASKGTIVRAISAVVRSIDKDLPIFDVRTQTEQIDATQSTERAFAALTLGFGLLALTLACIGIYGIMAYVVARRTGEIGIRMAMGAQNRQVLVMILRETVLLAGIGIVIGVFAAIGLTRYLENMLYGLKPFDPVTYSAAVLVMLAVALTAGWLPARRASRLDPMVALRHE
jgi:predicted permease